MGPDDKICYCNNVKLRKLLSFARRTHPKRPSQLSECLGAGTGCGWCIPTLQRIFDEYAANGESLDLDLTPEQYAAARQTYIESGQPNMTALRFLHPLCLAAAAFV